VWGALYEFGHGGQKERIRRPLWLVLLLFVANIIPILGLLANAFIVCVAICSLSVGNIFFNEDGKFIKFLTKNI
jgi:hypothetical protein